jgi:C4-dicarboxylate transporter DctM subunit
VTGAPPTAPETDVPGWIRRLRRVEEAVNLGFLVLMVLLPLLEVGLRPLKVSLPGGVQWVGVLTMWLGFSGALLATRDQRHLSLSTGGQLLKGKLAVAANLFTVAVVALTTALLAYGAWLTAWAEQGSTEIIPPDLPAWITYLALPLGYGLIAARTIFVRVRPWPQRLGLLAVVGALLFVVGQVDTEVAEHALWPLMGLVLLSTALGSPIYVALGALGLALFWADDEPVASVAAETLRQIKNPIMPTIPLFTFTGYVLAESKASARLVRVFQAAFGWLPGGLALMTAGVCAYFTTFTGASGVTILALGGLLYPMLLKDRYPEGFSVGLLTASGSIGLLFPPALPVILYGVVAHVPIDRMFVAGVVPGFVLVAALGVLGVRSGLKIPGPRPKLDVQEALRAAWAAKWELFLPAVVLVGIFGGLTTLVEAAALTAGYTLFVEMVIYRDLQPRDLLKVGRDCATLVGGVLIILGVAMGLTSYLVDAEIPAEALAWVEANIESKWVFLIVLNLFLLVVGCLMDIFSALVVVVPLILPIGAHFGIDPIHLGIIFLANLELGFLTPPVGMNLFLSSYRFEQPLTRVYKYTLPFLLILFAAVLLVTYVPALTLAPVEWVFGHLPEAPPIEF